MDDDSEEQQTVTHNGKVYRKVQIEGDDEMYLMDSEKRIYDMQMNLLGEAGDEE